MIRRVDGGEKKDFKNHLEKVKEFGKFPKEFQANNNNRVMLIINSL